MRTVQTRTGATGNIPTMRRATLLGSLEAAARWWWANWERFGQAGGGTGMVMAQPSHGAADDAVESCC